jgi:dihydrofolate synthase/folylpolyglutamate synthase
VTPADAEAFLLDLPRFADAGGAAYAPGLDRVRALLAAMGDPHVGLPVVHVAGTNGKGSTASFVAAIGTASGRRVGLHTSPHLLCLRERMRVDGVPAPPEWLAAAVAKHEDAMREIGPSFFEATVALSLLYFREQEVDLAVVEVGLGGRLDATNVVEPVVCLVTHIGLDHTDLLGDTLAEIAREKAGIAKPGVPFLHAADLGTTRHALRAEAKARGATLENVIATTRLDMVREGVEIRTETGTYGPVRLGLAGSHQRENAALAVRAAEIAMPGVDRQSVERGLREVVALAGIRGRGERWAEDPRIVLDVAHNPDGWLLALDHIDDTLVWPHAEGSRWVLFGAMQDKVTDAFEDWLEECWQLPTCGFLLADLPSPRALAAADLARRIEASGYGLKDSRRGLATEVFPGVAGALAHFRREAGPHDQLLITGSHVTVAEALAALEGART